MNIISRLRLRNVEKNLRAQAQPAECDDTQIFNALLAAYVGGEQERRRLEALASHRLPAVVAAVTAPIDKAKIKSAVEELMTEIPDSELDRILEADVNSPIEDSAIGEI